MSGIIPTTPSSSSGSTSPAPYKSLKERDEEMQAKWKDADPYTSIEAYHLKLESFGRRLSWKEMFIRENIGKEIRWRGQVYGRNLDHAPRFVTVSFFAEELQQPDCFSSARFRYPNAELVERIKLLDEGDIIEVVGKLTDESPGQFEGFVLTFIQPGSDPND